MPMRRLYGPTLALTLCLGLPFISAWQAMDTGPLLLVRISGAAATALLACSLLLILRLPQWSNLFGSLESMLHWHHILGVYGYLAALLHPLAMVWPFLPDDLSSAWLSVDPRYANFAMWLGWAALLSLALGLFVTLVLRLPYRTWRRLHLILALGALLGFLHGIYSVPDSIAAWSGLVLGGGAYLLRVLKIDRKHGGAPYEVAAISRHGDRVVEITLRPVASLAPGRPGQFVMAAFFDGPDFHGCGEYHPFTISGQDQDGALHISVKDAGHCTHRLQNVRPGTAVRLQGPFGSFSPAHSSESAIWIAGGIGIAPFLAALRAAPPVHETTLFYLYRPHTDAPYLAELGERASQYSALNYRPFPVEDDLSALFEALAALAEIASLQFYLCGPPAMRRKIEGFLASSGVAPAKIHQESFDLR